MKYFSKRGTIYVPVLAILNLHVLPSNVVYLEPSCFTFERLPNFFGTAMFAVHKDVNKTDASEAWPLPSVSTTTTNEIPPNSQSHMARRPTLDMLNRSRTATQTTLRSAIDSDLLHSQPQNCEHNLHHILLW